MRWGYVAIALSIVAGCSRNRTPAQPRLLVRTGDTKVSGAVMLGQPLTLVADWYGTCERYHAGDSDGEHDPGEGEWHPGTCNQVTSFDIDVKCSLPCAIGKQYSDVNFTVYRDVVPQQAGNLELEVIYKATLRDDRRLTYGVTVRAPKSVALLGCGNQKAIPLDGVVLSPPGHLAGPVPPIYCVKNDQEAEGTLRVYATTLDDQRLPMPIGVSGLDKDTVMDLPMHKLEKLFGEPIQDGVYPVRIEVMGKGIHIHVDVRGRIK